MEGEFVGGNRLTGVAGRGAMGVVYLADQVALNRRVAVKVVNPALAEDPEFRARFQHEARMAAALEHPHIVPVYAAGEDQGRLYLTMRYVEGTDLATALRREGPMPPELAVEVVEQVGSALDAAHARGLVHRDVKPANVMLTWSEGRPHAYLTDFGISKVVGAAGPTQTGTALGTLDYMAPELLVGDPYDGRADLYALGAVLYQALTGRVPFQRDTDAARMYAHLNDPVPEDPRIPPALMSVVRKAMAKQPAERYGTARELTSAARAALGGRPETGAPAPGAARSYERVGGGASGADGPGRRGVLIGGATGLLAAAGAGGWLWIRERGGGPTVGSGNASATSQLTLPDNEPGGRIDTTAPKLKVGPTPMEVQRFRSEFFTLNSDSTMSRVSVTNQDVMSIDVGSKPVHLLTGRSNALCLNEEFELIPVAVSTARTGTPVRFAPRTVYSVTTDDADIGWLASPDGLHRVDLNSGRTVTSVNVDRQLVSMTVHQGTLYALDLARSEVCRFNLETGQQSASPIAVASSVIAVGTVLSHLVVAGESDVWRLVGERLVTVPFLQGAQTTRLMFADDMSLWATLTESRQIQRVRPDLSGFLGAPVAGVTLGPKLLAAVWRETLIAVDDATSEVTWVTVTPLRAPA